MRTLILGMTCAMLVACGAKQADHVLPQYRGSVVVLLLGMPGCPGTEAATPFLARYAKEKQDGVVILRLDVPPPDESLPDMTGDVGIPREVDTDRKIATALEFFFYPTLYLLDRDGVVRFSGSCETGKVAVMVAELVAEKPGVEKKMFAPPLLAVGTKMPAWSGTTLAGEKVTLDGVRGTKATVLFFGATSCPYSNKALDDLPELCGDYEDKGVAMAVVTHSPADDKTRALHEKKVPELTVVADPDDIIGKETCKVPAVPFYVVLDAQGTVRARGPFTEAAARAALDAALGIKAAGTSPAAQGAG